MKSEDAFKKQIRQIQAQLVRPIQAHSEQMLVRSASALQSSSFCHRVLLQKPHPACKKKWPLAVFASGIYIV
jgi:hypothetical protein